MVLLVFTKSEAAWWSTKINSVLIVNQDRINEW
jgi:hypothetical protein